LFERLGEIGFVAFAHRGERRAKVQFEAYSDYFASRGDEDMAAMFARIADDEDRHEQLAAELLGELTSDEAAARRALRKVALWETGRNFRRLGRSTAETLWRVAATILYLASAPLSLLTRIVRPDRRGFLPPES